MVRLYVLLMISATMIFAAQSTQASILTYKADLNGPSEDTPNASPGTGTAVLNIDTILHTMRVQIEFSDLLGTTTVAHIHTPTAVAGTGVAGVATTTPTFPGFPSGVTSGIYDQTFDLTLDSSYNPSFVTANGGTTAGAETALLAGIADGKAYLNIHSSLFPAGEIRGFLVSVPEPSSIVLLGVGVVGLLAYGRRRSSVPRT